jgi:hypothetical protein
MIKTTTLSLEQSPSLKSPREEKKIKQTEEFGPSDLTIENILNYSKALQVMKPTTTETVFGVMN